MSTTDSADAQIPTHPCLFFNRDPSSNLISSSSSSSSAAASGAMAFFSLFDGRLHSLTLPTPSLCIGSGLGCLILSDHNSDLSIFNPTTNHHLHLPKLTTLDYRYNHFPHFGDPFNYINPVVPDPSIGTARIEKYSISLPYVLPAETIETPPAGLPRALISRACLLSNPSDGGDLTVFLLLKVPPLGLAFAKPGDAKWTEVSSVFQGFLDVACHQDEIYAVHFTGSVIAWQFGGHNRMIPTMKVTAEIVSKNMNIAEFAEEVREADDKVPLFYSRQLTLYLASSPSGDLLRVRKERDANTAAWLIKVHRVVFRESEWKLVEVKSLGEDVILLGANSAICVSSVGVSGLRRNSVYFAECVRGQDRCDVGIYSLDDGSVEPISLPVPAYPCPSWVMTNLA